MFTISLYVIYITHPPHVFIKRNELNNFGWGFQWNVSIKYFWNLDCGFWEGFLCEHSWYAHFTFFFKFSSWTYKKIKLSIRWPWFFWYITSSETWPKSLARYIHECFNLAVTFWEDFHSFPINRQGKDVLGKTNPA